jgi:hypothetical protein
VVGCEIPDGCGGEGGRGQVALKSTHSIQRGQGAGPLEESARAEGFPRFLGFLVGKMALFLWWVEGVQRFDLERVDGARCLS